MVPIAASVLSLGLISIMAPAAQETDLAAAQRKIERFWELNLYVRAAKEAEALRKQYPEEAQAWMLLARCHLQSTWSGRKDRRAEQAATRALKIAGRRPDILQALVLVNDRLRKDEEALQLIQELVDVEEPLLDPRGQAQMHALRAQILWRLQPQEDETAIRCLEEVGRALAVRPNNYTARLLRAKIRLSRDENDEAVEDLRVAVQSAPGALEVHHQLFQAYRRVGNQEAARHHLEVHRLLHRLTGSRASTAAPDPKEQIEILRQLKKLNPGDLTRRLELARLEAGQGNLEAARKECWELRIERPRWPALESLLAEIERRVRGGGE